VTTVDTNTFDAAIKASKIPVIVVFVLEGSVASARMVKRVKELDPTKVTVLKVDANKSVQLVLRFDIRRVPFLMKFLPTGELIATGNVLSEIIAAV